jgi:hypothetical protein
MLQGLKWNRSRSWHAATSDFPRVTQAPPLENEKLARHVVLAQSQTITLFEEALK